MTTEPFSPELEHLLSCLRAALGSAPWPAAADLRWDEFSVLIERHRVGAFLYTEHAKTQRTSWPRAVDDRLKDIAEQTLQRAVRQSAEQLRLLRVLGERGITVIVVKGVGLGERLYGGIGRRHVGDIDLLVATKDVAEADRALRAAGLRRTRPDFELTARQLQEYIRIKPEFEYVKPRPAQRIELLWRPENLPALDDIRSCALPRNLAGQTVLTLPPELELVYLFQHGARHGWFRLFWLVDIARMFQQNEADWAMVAATARVQGAERSMYQAAVLCASLLDVPAPPDLLPPPTESARTTRLATRAGCEIVGPTPEIETTREWLSRLAYRVRLQRTWRAKYAVLVPHLFSPESWRMWRLPDRWFFLYYPATPLLWLWRRFGGHQSNAPVLNGQ